MIIFYLPSSLQIKAKAAAAAAADALGDTGNAEEAGDAPDNDGQEVQLLTMGTSDSPIILDVLPKKSTIKSTAEEDRVLVGITERGQKSLELQQKMLEMLKPPIRNVTERTTYSDWTKYVMEDLDPALWRRFQLEHSQLLHKYLGMNDDRKSAATVQHADVVQQQFQTAPQSQQYQAPSPSSAMWQPPPQYWPGNVQPATSVWGSQSAEWVHRQTPELTLLQPRLSRTMTSHENPLASSTGTNNTPEAGECSFNIRGILGTESGDITPFNRSFIERITSTESTDTPAADTCNKDN